MKQHQTSYLFSPRIRLGFPEGEKAKRATWTPQRMDNSLTFFVSPFFLLVKVPCRLFAVAFLVTSTFSLAISPPIYKCNGNELEAVNIKTERVIGMESNSERQKDNYYINVFGCRCVIVKTICCNRPKRSASGMACIGCLTGFKCIVRVCVSVCVRRVCVLFGSEELAVQVSKFQCLFETL